MKEVNALLPKSTEDAESQSDSAEDVEEHWDGIAESPSMDHEAEYVDDDRFTTVTVEAVHISRDGFQRIAEELDDEIDRSEKAEESKSGQREDREINSSGKRVWTKERPGGPKKRKKKFRYESKAERKVTRHREMSHNRKQARERKS